MTDTSCFWAEGAISLRSVLSASSREVFEVFYLPPKANAHRSALREKEALLALCRSRNIPVTQRDEAFFHAHAKGNTHGGILARVGEKHLVSPEELCKQETPFLAYLCGIEDPYNFSACLRTLYAAGCSGVFLPERNWMSAGSVILRSSAGASEHLPMATVPSDANAFLALLENYNISPICAREKRAETLYDCTLSRPLCLIIGGERRGIDKALDEKVSRGVVIPYGSNARTSLSAQAACAVISFEILRQQHKG